MTKRTVLFIPHCQMLSSDSVQDWIETFQTATRARPSEIALPGVGFLGPCFDSKVFGYPSMLGPSRLLPDWVKQARSLMGQEARIWAVICPTYPFLELETVMVEDQFGIRFDDNACVANPVVQQITDEFIQEIAGYGVDGVALNLTDIEPNSSSNVVPGTIQNTCFCSHCRKELALSGWSEAQKPFLHKERNIARIVLKLTETGADHIDARAEWVRDGDVDSIVKFSEARGFVADDEETRADAALLLRYLDARRRVVADAVRKLGSKARASGLAVAAILGDANVDMSTMTDLATMVSTDSASEYWVPAVDADYVHEHGVVVLQMLYGRGGYGLNGFFEYIGNADRNIAIQGVDHFVSSLLRRTRTAQANQLNPGSVFAVGVTGEYTGLVGCPIGQQHFVKYVEDLTRGPMGVVLPGELIEAIVSSVKLSSASKSRA